MKRIVLLPLLVVALASFAGCSGLRSEAGVDRTYVLNAAPAAGGTQPLPVVLSVPRPAVDPGLDTDRIALRRPGNEMDYYAASRFGDALPRVLSALVVQSLAGADGFATVVNAERAALPGNFELLLTVRRFEAEYTTGSALPQVQVAIDCLLVTGAPRRVLGSCNGAATEPAAADRMGEIVLTLERATQRALGQIRTKAAALARMVPPAPAL